MIGLAGTLLQIARYKNTPAERLAELKRLAGKLPPVPFDLTDKNKELLAELESRALRAKLVFLPERLLGAAADALGRDRINLVDAEVAIAVDVMLAAPMRPENLAALCWDRHFREPNGQKGKLIVHLPASETKTDRELIYELPAEVAQRVRWYRRSLMPRVGADPNGSMFVTRKGNTKSQGTLTDQIIERIENHVGVHMTPHQFRHFAATSYLEHHPEDFETARQFLGHASPKTTLVYAGSATRRASRVFGNFVLAQREALKLQRPRGRRR